MEIFLFLDVWVKSYAALGMFELFASSEPVPLRIANFAKGRNKSPELASLRQT